MEAKLQQKSKNRIQTSQFSQVIWENFLGKAGTSGQEAHQER